MFDSRSLLHEKYMKIDRQEIYRMSGYIGLAIVLAGLFRYFIQDVWVGEGFAGKLTPAMIIVGLVLIAVSIVFNFREIAGLFSRRQGKLGVNTIVLSAAVLALISTANVLGYRHHKRFDLTPEGLHSISDQTRKVLANLSKDVKVMYFSQNESQISDLMEEYKYASQRITYERIDPNQRPALVMKYKLQREGDIVVAAGERHETISSATEQAVTNAILKVTRDVIPTVCFTEGHGEKSLSDQDVSGYSLLDERLKNENYQIKTVLLEREKQVPSECVALVVAGPQQSVTEPEAAMIGKYLDNGGRTLLLLDPEVDTKLGDVLKSWNIIANDTTVIDQSGNSPPLIPGIRDYGDHPITKGFGTAMIYFPKARAIKVDSGAGGVNVTPLLTSSERSFAKEKIPAGENITIDEGKDQKGPLTIGAAASKNVNGKEARLVVIGDSDFASNALLFRFKRSENLFLNSVDWLVGNEDLISISRAQNVSNHRFEMDGIQSRLFLVFSLAIIPLAFIGSGVYIWWKRR
jgi:ABC-type uncharacterized transport system involved in gliding motility auxiliary subunit